MVTSRAKVGTNSVHFLNVNIFVVFDLFSNPISANMANMEKYKVQIPGGGREYKGSMFDPSTQWHCAECTVGYPDTIYLPCKHICEFKYFLAADFMSRHVRKLLRAC